MSHPATVLCNRQKSIFPRRISPQVSSSYIGLQKDLARHSRHYLNISSPDWERFALHSQLESEPSYTKRSVRRCARCSSVQCSSSSKQEDIAYIYSGLLLSGRWEEWRQCGGHVMAVNRKSEFVHPLAIAQMLKIPVFVMYDADGAFKM